MCLMVVNISYVPQAPQCFIILLFFFVFFTSSSCYAFKMKVSIHVMGITVVYSLKNRRTTRRHLLYIPVMPPYVDVRYRLSMEGGEHPHFLSLCTILNWQQKNCKSNVILKNSCKVSQLLLLLFQKYEKCLRKIDSFKHKTIFPLARFEKYNRTGIKVGDIF